jgi:tetratricopeptide (TPR) repeat protein
MKSFTYFCLVLGCLVFISACSNQQQGDQMMITTSSEEAKQLFVQGRDKAENIELAAAMMLIDQALEKDPDFALAHLQRAMLGGNLTKSRAHLNKAVALVDKVSPGEAHYILYVKSNFDGDGAKRQEHMKKLLEILPNDLRVLDLAGIYYYAFTNEYKKALEYYKKAIQIDPNFAPPYNMIGYTQVELKNFDEAEKAFKKYIELVPNSPNSYDSYAEFLMTLGKYDQSIENYQKAYDTDNMYTTALNGIANNYVLKGDLNKAREYYSKQHQEAVPVNEKFGSLFSVIDTYVIENDIDGAIKACEELHSMAEAENLVQFQIGSMNTAGFILAEKGNLDDAAAYYKKAAEIIESAELDDADKDRYKYFAGVNHCYILTKQNKLDEATKEGENCLGIAKKRQNPGELQFIHGQLGVLELKKENYKQALDHLNQADPQSPYNWYQMAVAYEGLNQNDKANELFDQIANQNEVRLDLILVRDKAREKL